ncbi:BLOC-2 complex member HPS5-like [Oscarella lobularis]|uniref:BLOC-2 complex member HPS5-like n=1 Tax=Oscarella lobularis TaxID=121494 RepID=UPI00331436C8
MDAVLYNVGPLIELFEPIKGTVRVKYTALAASSRHLAAGANTGAVYCFDRQTLRLLRLLANKEGHVTHLRFSPGGRLLALACQKTIVVWDHNVEGKAKPRRVKVVGGDAKLNYICWDGFGSRLFSGDERGHVRMMSVATSKIKSGINMKESDLIFRADTPVVQLDFFAGKLLVSTVSQCWILDPQSPRTSALPVGTKPRDGIYGACVAISARIIYSARPGSRIWEADFDGKVMATHQLKNLLAVRPSTIWGYGYADLDEASDEKVWPPQALAFGELVLVNKKYLLSWLSDGLYIFDVMSGTDRLLAWTNQLEDISGVCLYGDHLFVLHQSSLTISHLVIMKPVEAARHLYAGRNHSQCARLLLTYEDSVIPSSARILFSVEMLSELVSYLEEADDEVKPARNQFLTEKIRNLIGSVEDGPVSTETSSLTLQRYHSTGIIVVNEAPSVTQSLPLHRHLSVPAGLSFLNPSESASLSSSPRDGSDEELGSVCEEGDAGDDQVDGEMRAPDAAESSPGRVAEERSSLSETPDGETELFPMVEESVAVAVAVGTEPSPSPLDVPFPEVIGLEEEEREEDRRVQPALKRVVSLVQRSRDEGLLELNDGDSVALSLPAVRKKRRKKKKEVEILGVPRRRSKEEVVDSFSTVDLHAVDDDQSQASSRAQSPPLSPNGSLSPQSFPHISLAAAPAVEGGGDAETANGDAAAGAASLSLADVDPEMSLMLKPRFRDSGILNEMEEPVESNVEAAPVVKDASPVSQLLDFIKDSLAQEINPTALESWKNRLDEFSTKGAATTSWTEILADFDSESRHGFVELTTRYVETAPKATTFLRRYHQVIDTWRVRETLVNTKSYSEDCWSALTQDAIGLSGESADELTRRILHSTSSVNVLPLLCRLYELDCFRAVSVCSELYPSIFPIEVAFLCQLLAENRRPSQAVNTQGVESFLEYIDLLAEKPGAVRSLLRDDVLSFVWLEAALLDCPDKSFLVCSNGTARSGSHAVAWKRGKEIEMIIKESSIRGYWLGYVDLLCVHNQREKAIDTLARLGDIGLIENPQPWGNLPASGAEWVHLLSIAFDKRDLKLNGEALARVLVRHRGPSFAAEVLSQLKIPPDSGLDVFTKTLFQCFAAKESEEKLSQTMLEKLDSYLWSPKPIALTPALQYSVENKKGSDEEESLSPAQKGLSSQVGNINI